MINYFSLLCLTCLFILQSVLVHTLLFSPCDPFILYSFIYSPVLFIASFISFIDFYSYSTSSFHSPVGRSYAVRSHRMFQQCIDSLVQKVQSGVVINFEKIGPDPPPINSDGKCGTRHSFFLPLLSLDPISCHQIFVLLKDNASYWAPVQSYFIIISTSTCVFK